MSPSLTRKYNAIVARYSGNDARGKAYEQFLLSVLPKMALFQNETVTVFKYPDWANAQPRSVAPIKHDTGMDFVIEAVSVFGTMRRYGVQAKFVENSAKNVGLDAVTGLLGVQTQVQAHFDGHFVVSNADDATKSAEETARRSATRIEFILRDRMARELSHLSKLPTQPGKTKTLTTAAPTGRVLWPHQKNTVAAVLDSLKMSGGVCHYVSACGTGKTVTSWAIASRLDARLALFAAPQLSLLNQTIASYRRESGNTARFVVACSDLSIGSDSAPSDEVRGYVFSDAQSIADRVQWLQAQPGGPIIVLTTYMSAHLISEAQTQYGMDEFDFAFLDEAHRLVAATRRHSEKNGWQLLDPTMVRTKNRVAATATPRIIATRSDRNAPKYDRMNEEYFGPLAYKYPFGQAIADGILVPYDVVIHSASPADALDLSGADHAGAIDLEFEVSLQSVKEAFDKGARRFVSYHTTRKISKEFARRIWADYGIASDYVDGTMSARERAAKFARFDAESTDQDGYLLSNVNVVTEGVDIPRLDAVVMAQAYSTDSAVTIAQSVGRVLRTAPGKTRGMVIVPAIFQPGQETPGGSKGERRIISVLVAMMQHDASLGEVFLAEGLRTITPGTRRSGRYSSIKSTGPMPSGAMFTAAKAALARVSTQLLDISRANKKLTESVILETIQTRFAELGRQSSIDAASYRSSDARCTPLHADIITEVYREFETEMSENHARFVEMVHAEEAA